MAAPIRILMICPQFRPLLGGYEQAAERLSLELTRRGHAVTVVTERRDRSWPALEDLDRVRIERIACSTRPGLHTISAILSLVFFLLRRRNDFDVLHAHQYGWTSTAAILCGSMIRKPVVLKLTSTGPSGIRSELSKLPASAIHLQLHRRLSACVVTSERARAEAIEIGIEASQVHLIPNGLDTERFSPASDTSRKQARERLNLDESLLAITVCRICPDKDLPLLLDAWAPVHEALPHARLAIVGDGAGMEELKERAERLDLGTSVLLPGNSPDPTDWYSAADLYVLSSINEGLSNALMEGVSSGLPIVSTRVSGSEDIVEVSDAGILVPIGDAAALGKAIVELLRDPERARECGLRSREYAVDHFSLQSVSEQIEMLYGNLISGS